MSDLERNNSIVTRDDAIAAVNQLVLNATSCGGKFFGDVVINVLYPMSINPTSFNRGGCHTIQVFFRTDGDAANFQEKSKEYLTLTSSHTHMNVVGDLGQSRRFRLGCAGSRSFGNVYVLICDVLPQRHFDIDTLCYEGHSLLGPVWSVDGNETKLAVLLEKISEKRAHMLNHTLNDLGDKDSERERIALERLCELMDYDWTITALDEDDNIITLSEGSIIPPVIKTSKGYRFAATAQLSPAGLRGFATTICTMLLEEVPNLTVEQKDKIIHVCGSATIFM